MDKQTLSNYGWIVICVLVLSVLIALATPFGVYVQDGIESTTQGLFDTENKALTLALDTTGTSPKIIEGAGQTYNLTTATTQLSFCSSADYSTFKEVKIDGETVASENYTVTETESGTLITFTNEYAKILSNGNHTIDVVSNVGTATSDFIIINPFTTLTAKTWNGSISYFDGNYIWTDGTNYYYSNDTAQYVLDKATSTWVEKTWTGLTSFDGNNVWTDGTNYYYSSGYTHYKFS